MALFILLVFIVATVSATTPVLNGTDGDSVPISKPVSVPRRCPPNEVLKAKLPCPPDTCDTIYLSFLCIANQTETVVCTCKDGYRRTNSTASGVCVPEDRCLPPECADDPNAKRGCGNRCKKTCADYNDTNKVCNNNVCKLYGCECQDGFVYDENINKCVKPKQCTKQCKKPHERYSSCLIGECVPKTCVQVGYPVACPDIIGPCAGGCTCEEGYVRNCNGDCIEMKKCPCCGGDPNAVSGCGNPCGKTCASLYANTSDLICPQYCEYNGCDCKPGYRLNTTDSDSKKCIPESECPKPPQQCGENEQYYCGTSCPEASCANPSPSTCVNKKCKLACFCKKGFVRDANNKCVPVNKCPKQCTKPHERYSSCLLGECVPKTCGDLGMPLPCPRVMPPCAGGCICEEGYVRDKKGNCIDAKTCPSCGGDPNAEAGCGNPCGRTCASLKTNSRKKRDTAAPACATFCLANGCDCKEGYILNTDLKPPRCVLPKDCNKPQNCTGANEQYTDCVQGQCRPTTCKDVNKMPICPTTTKPCSGGCICKTGFVRSDNGTCIAINDCPEAGSCSDPNQAWVQCAVNCANAYCPKDDQPQPICFLPAGVCFPGCKCKPNFRIDKNNKCIPARDCPAVPCTRYNEEYDSCPDRITSCALLGTTPVTNTGSKICNPACICKEGFYQNANGTCVPKCECSSDTDSSG